MLQSFREQSGKWFIKVLFGAIIASFMVWGIGDVIRSYSQNRPIAKVGRQSITYEDYAMALQQEISRLQQRIKARLTPSQLQNAGVYQNVLERLIQQNVLEQELNQSGLSVSDNLVRGRVHAVPAFQQNGVFDKRLFQELLRHNGTTEAHFLQEIRQTLLTQQLMLPLIQGMLLPTFYQEILFKALYEKKVFTLVTIPIEKVVLKQQPSIDDLKLRYEQNKENYAVPEFRTTTLVLIQTKKLLEQIPVSEEEIKQEYEQQSQQFIKAERRSVKRVTCSTEVQALEAIKQINSNRPMPSVARNLQGEYEDLGTVEKKELPEIAADVVFNLSLGKVSEVINTGFGFTVYQVTRIEPETMPTLNEVQTQIIENLRVQKFGDHLKELRNQIEDSLAAGVKLPEVAKTHHLVVETIPSFNQHGLTVEGKPVLPSLPAEVKKQIIEQAFTLNEGGESPVTEVNSEIAFVLQVDKVLPSYIPDFNAIQSDVAKDWKAEKSFEQASQLAQNLIQQVRSLSDLMRLANQNGLTLTSNHTLSRMDVLESKQDKLTDLQKQVSPEGIDKAFQLPLEAATYGLMNDHKGFAILMLQRAEPFTPDPKKMQQFQALIKNLIEQDISALLMASFRSHYPITINQDMMKMFSQEGSS